MSILSPLRTRSAWAACGFYALANGVFSIVCAAPISQLTSRVVANWQHGDAPLFRAGGTLLVETLRIHGSAYFAAGMAAGLQLAAFAFLLVLPLTALVTALCDPEMSLVKLRERTARHLLTFVLLGALSLLVRALVAGVALLAFGALRTLLSGSLSEIASDVSLVIALAVAWGSQLVVGAGFDFARSAVVLGKFSALRSLPVALECLLRRPRQHLLNGLLIGGASLCGPIAAGLITAQLDTASPETWPLLLVAISHQLGLLSLLLGKVHWLSYSATATREIPGLFKLELPGDTIAQNAELGVPSRDPGA